MKTDYDVLIVGGGPAGCSAATILAQQGWDVLVLEKERFPRYRVGESMLPYCYFPLERLGLLETMKATTFTKKYSVQFISENGKVSAPFYFDQHLDHPAAQTWQVERRVFDQILLDHARTSGATVHEGISVTELVQDDSGRVIGVEARNDDGETHTFRAPLTMDASGRAGFAIGKLKWRVMDDMLKKIAIWGYFRGAVRDEGRNAGATTVAYVNGKDWFWYIPLQDDLVSVGLVGGSDSIYAESRDLGEIFCTAIGRNAWIKGHLEPAEFIGDLQVTGDFSYRSRHCSADGLVLIGDAFAFLDPVFSSGLMLALYSGVQAADAAHIALGEQDVSAERFAAYGEQMCAGIEAMRSLVYAFYSKDFSFRPLFKKYPHLRHDVTDCLIGHLERDYTELFTRMREFADLPDPLSHGRPMPSNEEGAPHG